MYDIPDTRSGRQAAIGYGQRSSTSTSKDHTPGPSHYKINEGNIENDYTKKKGWTMGVSREVAYLC
jgi:hypothetical protein